MFLLNSTQYVEAHVGLQAFLCRNNAITEGEVCVLITPLYVP